MTRRLLIFVPYVLAEVIAGVIWFQLLQPGYGVVDTLVRAVGLTPPEQGFLGIAERNARFTIISAQS